MGPGGGGGAQGLSQAVQRQKKYTPAAVLPFWPHWGLWIKNDDMGEGVCQQWGRLCQTWAVGGGRCGPKRPKKIQEFQFFFGRSPWVLPACENCISKQGVSGQSVPGIGLNVNERDFL